MLGEPSNHATWYRHQPPHVTGVLRREQVNPLRRPSHHARPVEATNARTASPEIRITGQPGDLFDGVR